MARLLAVLFCMFLVGCSGAAQGVRRATGQRERCVYVPRRHLAPRALNEALHSARAGLEVVPVAATTGASPVAPLGPSSSPLLEGLSGEGLRNGIPRGVLRIVPEGATTAAESAGVGGAAGELIVTGGAIVAAAGGVLLVCLTVSAVVDGVETPIDVADEFYGTHFGDVSGWVQGQHPMTKAPKGPTSAPLAPPGASPTAEPGSETKKNRGRVYVTYTKLNNNTRRYYAGRTSMVVDLTKSLGEQAWLAVILRDVNHHIDENDEPKIANTMFAPPLLDRFDVGAAVEYGKRYDDAAYWRIRGREQQLIDSHGGARSDTGKPYRTENTVRGVAKDNPWSRGFHDAATDRWGQLHPYTGY